MPKVPRRYGYTKWDLYERGVERVSRFCEVNSLTLPAIVATPRDEWYVAACAYYRPVDLKTDRFFKKTLKPGINICLEECASVCNSAPSRNWNWPGSTTDREPYGVLAHEIGHHADWSVGVKKWSYGSEYCEVVMALSGEPPITSYCPNPAEWFAECFRLFVTNAALLAQIRPKTHAILLQRFKPVSGACWFKELGANVPERVVKALRNKFRA